MSNQPDQHDAENMNNDHDTQVAELQEQLAAREREIETVRRQYALDRLLRDAGAADLETTHLVIESRLEADAGADQADLATLVEELKKSKPFLFERGTTESSSARSPSRAGVRSVASSPSVEPRADDHLTHAAAEAHITQKKSDLMRYLRLRRKFYQRE